MHKLPNIKIEGIGSVYGGPMESISIQGIGKVKGDMEAVSFQSEGISKATGRVRAETIHNEGICRCKGDVLAKTLRNEGVLKVRGKVETGEFISDGTLFIKQSISTDIFRCIFHHYSYIKEIFGDTVEILRNDPHNPGNNGKQFHAPAWAAKLFLGIHIQENAFVSETIECTKLQADHLVARTVRAQEVALGPGCRVETVEYSRSFSAHESAVVEQVRQIR